MAAHLTDSFAVPNSVELSRLIAAAVVNKRFCRMLLADAAEALGGGFSGETFRLDPDERALVLSIRAESLADFAQQLAAACRPPIADHRERAE